RRRSSPRSRARGATRPRAPAAPPTAGALVIIGGHEDRKGERRILREVARRAEGRGIAVITAATEEPEALWKEYVGAFDGLGRGADPRRGGRDLPHRRGPAPPDVGPRGDAALRGDPELSRARRYDRRHIRGGVRHDRDHARGGPRRRVAPPRRQPAHGRGPRVP